MQKQVIEFAGVPVGIVIPDADRLKVIAVKIHVHELDEQHFDSPAEVKRAIRDLLANRKESPTYA